jgi:intracellular sulfur oxidation DsrE/DsrF family protein
MKIKRLILIAVLCLSTTLASAAEQVKYRLLIQVSEDSIDKMNSALNTARNVQHTFGPENIEEVTTEGTRIVACEIAMRTHKLRPSDMLEQVRYVPSGVAEIVEKQTAGWSYIRP